MAKKKVEKPNGAQKDPVQHLSELIHGIQVAMMTTVEAAAVCAACPCGHIARVRRGALVLHPRAHPQGGQGGRDQNVNLATPARQGPLRLGRGHCPAGAGQGEPASSGTPPSRPGSQRGSRTRTSPCCVKVEKAEYWDSANGRMVQLVGFVKSVFTGKPYKPGENERSPWAPRARTSASTEPASRTAPGAETRASGVSHPPGAHTLGGCVFCRTRVLLKGASALASSRRRRPLSFSVKSW